LRALLLLALLTAAPAKAPRPAPRRAAADAGVAAPDAPRAAALKPSPQSHGAMAGTKCGACHITAAWTDVRFNHDRTGFPLLGAHTATACKGCHGDDFQRPLPTTCSGCHRDVHAGDLGMRCEGCHDSASWASKFEADAHRRTAFPLVGAHAALPCTECHGQASARKFSRAAVECIACHQADVDRTRGTAIDHAALGFTDSCRSCHQAYRFKPALFPDHDRRCYLVSVGAHAGIPCLGCHDGFPPTPAPAGTCSTRTIACTACHSCTGPGGATATDARHAPPATLAAVPGYACAERRCYGCHKEVTGP